MPQHRNYSPSGQVIRLDTTGGEDTVTRIDSSSRHEDWGSNGQLLIARCICVEDLVTS